MIIETLFAGRDNTFSLQLIRGEQPINLLGLSSYKLYLANGRIFEGYELFNEKANGVVEIMIGALLTEADVGTHTAYLVTFDPTNIHGVRWPKFKLKVLQ